MPFKRILGDLVKSGIPFDAADLPVDGNFNVFPCRDIDEQTQRIRCGTVYARVSADVDQPGREIRGLDRSAILGGRIIMPERTILQDRLGRDRVFRNQPEVSFGDVLVDEGLDKFFGNRCGSGHIVREGRNVLVEGLHLSTRGQEQEGTDWPEKLFRLVKTHSS